MIHQSASAQSDVTASATFFHGTEYFVRDCMVDQGWAIQAH
jgi:hypothetical protein